MLETVVVMEQSSSDMMVTKRWDWPPLPLSETYVHSPSSGGDQVDSVTHVTASAVSSPRSDSGLNSMEYWDYSVELECITGQQGNTMIRHTTADISWL